MLWHVKIYSSFLPSDHTVLQQHKESRNMVESYYFHLATAYLVAGQQSDYIRIVTVHHQEKNQSHFRTPCSIRREGCPPKDSIIQVYGKIQELVTLSLVCCILTAQSLCCSLYSHCFRPAAQTPGVGSGRRKNFLYLYTEPPTSATTLSGGKFVRRENVMCLRTELVTSVTAVFGRKLRRRHKWSTRFGPLSSLL